MNVVAQRKDPLTLEKNHGALLVKRFLGETLWGDSAPFYLAKIKRGPAHPCPALFASLSAEYRQ